jgi:hypothetical protein
MRRDALLAKVKRDGVLVKNIFLKLIDAIQHK